MHDSKERYDAPKCHEDTRKAVIKDITSWVLDDTKDTLILWISAPAGSGKSAILQTIAELFDGSKGLAASFFFSRTAAQRQTEAHLIATIAANLAVSIPETRPFIDQAVRDDLSVFDKTLPVQMKHLVIQPLICASLQAGRSSPQSSRWPSLLVIDGLDECRGGKVQAAILRMLNDALLQLKHSLPSLCLIIASRPEPTICEVFEDKLNKTTYHLVLDDSYDPDRDIATFLRSSFSDIHRRRHTRFPSMSSLPLPWPSEETISFLVKKSSGHFIFAATVIRFVDEDRKLPPAQLELVLHVCKSLDASQHETHPFGPLDQLYAHILRSCDKIDRVLSLLGTIFFLDGHAPIPVFLESLVGINLESISLLFWDLNSLIHVPVSSTDPVRFYHASFRDYLVDRHRAKDLHVDEHAAQSLLLKSCMRQLGSVTMSPAMKYSQRSWTNHYIRGDSLKTGSLDTFLENFKSSACWGPNVESQTASPDLLYWWSVYDPTRSKIHHEASIYFMLRYQSFKCPFFQCASVMPACTPLCHRFNSIFDQHLLSWLEAYPWTKLEIALTWLTLLLHFNGFLEPPWWHHIYLSCTLNNPGISWLWNLRFETTSQHWKIVYFLQAFLESPKRCCHLSVGESTTGHFAHLCAQIVLDGCLGSTDSLHLRYLLLLCFCMLNIQITHLCQLSSLPSWHAAKAPG